jgi:ABC-2 type transport system permease protein
MAVVMGRHAIPLRAVLWAQMRVLRNLYPRSNRLATTLAGLLTVFWYSLWTALAVFIAGVLRRPDPSLDLPNLLSNGLLLVFAYWQLVPLILISSGMSLDLRRIAVYPISTSELFWLEVLLRVTSSLEMLIVLAGTAVGLVANPQWPPWTPLALIPFVLLNLLVGVAVKDLLTRLLAQRGWRELVVLMFVSLAALPQYVSAFGMPGWLKALMQMSPPLWLPWTATASLLLGHPLSRPLSILLGWLLCTYIFARWQFTRSLGFDRDEKKAAEEAGPRSGLIEYFYRLPRRFLRDPLAALLEKELRFLSRAPRFRLVFLMGFSFGLMIWLPIAMGRLGDGTRTGFLANHFLTVICIYALTLLAEVAFWNHLGFDRGAAQLYFLAPVNYRTVIIAKNLAGFAFLLLELAAVFLVMIGLQLPLYLTQFVEAVAVTLVLGLFLASVGNAGSTLYARPIDPTQPWRASSAGKFHTLLILFYPVASIPILLAYAARYVLGSQLAFYAVLMLGVGVGLAIYRAVLDFVSLRAERDREQIIVALSATAGPVAS